jgi:hypothetical protein
MLNFLAYYNDVCVGTVCCRKEVDETNPEMYKIYMMTLGVLEPYRHLGIGKQFCLFLTQKKKKNNYQAKKLTSIIIRLSNGQAYFRAS